MEADTVPSQNDAQVLNIEAATVSDDMSVAQQDDKDAKAEMATGANTVSAKQEHLDSKTAASLLSAYREQLQEVVVAFESLGSLRPAPDAAAIQSVASVTIKQLGPYIEGSHANVDALVTSLMAGVAEDSEAVGNAIRNLLVTDATRKSYHPDKQRVKRANALEDSSTELLWRWEVKRTASLGDEKDLAVLQRAWCKQVHVRVSALITVIRLLSSNLANKKNNAAAVAALERLKHLGDPGAAPTSADVKPGATQAGSKQVDLQRMLQRPKDGAKRQEDAGTSSEKPASLGESSAVGKLALSAAEKEQRKAQDAAERQRQKEAAAAEKAAAAAARQAQKEAEAKERQAKREADALDRQLKKAIEAAEKKRVKEEEAAEKKQQKEAEAAEKKRQKEEEAAEKKRQKEAEAAEKKRQKELAAVEREQQKEREQLQKQREREEAHKRKAAEKAGFGNASSLRKSMGMMANFVKKERKSGEAATSSATASPARVKEAPPSEVEHIRESLHASLDIDVKQEWAALLNGRWRALGQQLEKSRVPGLPPSWARKKNCVRDPAELSRMVYGRHDWRNIKAWRRKLLHFPSDGLRPPFYGSFTRKSKLVKPRHVFAKDPDMDYEVLSDEEWEEEPEGEELNDNDGAEDEEDTAAADEEDDGFMVDDGYLSDDERNRYAVASEGEDDDEDDDCLNDAEVLDMVGLKDGATSELEPCIQNYLNALLNAKKSGQPLVLCREGSTVTLAQGQQPGAQAEPLEALTMKRLVSDVVVRPVDKDTLTAPVPRRKRADVDAALVAEVALFINSLDDEQAQKKARIVEAFLNSTDHQITKSHLSGAVIPASATYCKRVSRWVSSEIAAQLLDPEATPEGLASLCKAVNSERLARLASSGRVQKLPFAGKGTATAGKPSCSPSKAQVAGRPGPSQQVRPEPSTSKLETSAPRAEPGGVREREGPLDVLVSKKRRRLVPQAVTSECAAAPQQQAAAQALPASAVLLSAAGTGASHQHGGAPSGASEGGGQGSAAVPPKAADAPVRRRITPQADTDRSVCTDGATNDAPAVASAEAAPLSRSGERNATAPVRDGAAAPHDAVRVVREPPQPGQNDGEAMDAWMEDPDRPRLPGGGGGCEVRRRTLSCDGHDDAAWLDLGGDDTGAGHSRQAQPLHAKASEQSLDRGRSQHGGDALPGALRSPPMAQARRRARPSGKGPDAFTTLPGLGASKKGHEVPTIAATQLEFSPPRLREADTLRDISNTPETIVASPPPATSNPPLSASRRRLDFSETDPSWLDDSSDLDSERVILNPRHQSGERLQEPRLGRSAQQGCGGNAATGCGPAHAHVTAYASIRPRALDLRESRSHSRSQGLNSRLQDKGLSAYGSPLSHAQRQSSHDLALPAFPAWDYGCRASREIPARTFQGPIYIGGNDDAAAADDDEQMRAVQIESAREYMRVHGTLPHDLPAELVQEFLDCVEGDAGVTERDAAAAATRQTLLSEEGLNACVDVGIEMGRPCTPVSPQCYEAMGADSPMHAVPMSRDSTAPSPPSPQTPDRALMERDLASLATCTDQHYVAHGMIAYRQGDRCDLGNFNYQEVCAELEAVFKSPDVMTTPSHADWRLTGTHMIEMGSLSCALRVSNDAYAAMKCAMMDAVSRVHSAVTPDNIGFVPLRWLDACVKAIATTHVAQAHWLRMRLASHVATLLHVYYDAVSGGLVDDGRKPRPGQPAHLCMAAFSSYGPWTKMLARWLTSSYAQHKKGGGTIFAARKGPEQRSAPGQVRQALQLLSWPMHFDVRCVSSRTSDVVAKAVCVHARRAACTLAGLDADASAANIAACPLRSAVKIILEANTGPALRRGRGKAFEMACAAAHDLIWFTLNALSDHADLSDRALSALSGGLLLGDVRTSDSFMRHLVHTCKAADGGRCVRTRGNAYGALACLLALPAPKARIHYAESLFRALRSSSGTLARTTALAAFAELLRPLCCSNELRTADEAFALREGLRLLHACVSMLDVEELAVAAAMATGQSRRRQMHGQPGIPTIKHALQEAVSSATSGSFVPAGSDAEEHDLRLASEITETWRSFLDACDAVPSPPRHEKLPANTNSRGLAAFLRKPAYQQPPSVQAAQRAAADRGVLHNPAPTTTPALKRTSEAWPAQTEAKPGDAERTLFATSDMPALSAMCQSQGAGTSSGLGAVRKRQSLPEGTAKPYAVRRLSKGASMVTQASKARPK